MYKFENRNLLIALIIICLGCNNYSEKKEIPKLKNELGYSEITTIEKGNENKKWIDYFNAKSDSLKYLYGQKAIKILSDGTVLNGSEQIKNHLLKDSSKLVSILSDTVILANKRKVIEYEISENVFENAEKYKNLVIWQLEDSERKRIFEFTVKIDKPEENLQAVESRRKLWISLCNNHDAQALIEALYSENTLYFNHKPIVEGHERLIDEYQYMNNEKYGLSLQPIIVTLINKNFIFEIGQCSGSYKGKYILIWKKEEDGKWRIFIDSNI